MKEITRLLPTFERLYQQMVKKLKENHTLEKHQNLNTWALCFINGKTVERVVYFFGNPTVDFQKVTNARAARKSVTMHKNGSILQKNGAWLGDWHVFIHLPAETGITSPQFLQLITCLFAIAYEAEYGSAEGVRQAKQELVTITQSEHIFQMYA